MSKKALAYIVAGILILVGIGVWVYSANQKPVASTTPAPYSEPAATIIYSSNGFSPKVTTVHTGAIIAIRNTTPSGMQFSSDDSELNVGTVAAGKTVTLKVTTAGTHVYYSQSNPNDTGTITVQ